MNHKNEIAKSIIQQGLELLNRASEDLPTNITIESSVGSYNDYESFKADLPNGGFFSVYICKSKTLKAEGSI